MNSIFYGTHTTLVILTQAAIGISIFRPVHFMTEQGHGSSNELFILFLLALIGALVSAFHLGHPARMFTALKNPSRSWLSREIICPALFLGMTFMQLVFGLCRDWC